MKHLDHPEDGLIHHHPELTEGKFRFSLAVVVVGVFFISTFGTGLLDGFYGIEPPAPAGAEKKAEDKLRAEAQLRDGSAARLFERDWRKQSRVRSVVGPTYSFMLYRYFGEAKSAAVVGKDGWFFIRDRIRTVDVVESVNIPLSASLIEAVDRRLKSVGVTLVVCPIPRKAVAYSEFLPRGAEVDHEPYGLFVQDLRSRGIVTADILDAYRSFEGDRLYNKVDSHWSDLGMLVAAMRVAQDGGFIVDEGRRLHIPYKISEKPEPGDIAKMIEIEVPEKWKDFFDSGTKASVWRLIENERPRKITPRLGKESSLAIAGTSFSDDRMFPDFVGHFAGRPIWTSAKRAVGPVEPLRTLIREIQKFETMPEFVVWEIPIHNVFSVDRPMRGMGRVFSEAPIGSQEILTTDSPWIPSGTLKPGTLAGGKRVTTRTVGGGLVVPSNGSISIRLKGTLKGGEKAQADVTVDCSKRRLYGRWDAGRGEIVLPVVAGGMTDIINVGVTPKKGTTVELESVDVVIDAKLSALDLPEGDVREENGRWTWEVSIPNELTPGKRDALVLNINSANRLNALEVAATTAQGATRLAEMPRALPKSVLVVPLKAAAGTKLRSIRLSGQGKKPRTLEIAVRVAESFAN